MAGAGGRRSVRKQTSDYMELSYLPVSTFGSFEWAVDRNPAILLGSTLVYHTFQGFERFSRAIRAYTRVRAHDLIPLYGVYPCIASIGVSR